MAKGLILQMNDLDATIEISTGELHNETGFDVVRASELGSELASIDRGGALLINGHGSPTRLGGKTPVEMAKLLADGGLRGPVEIQLFACNTGTTGAPYALELKVALVQGHKIMCSVASPRGTIGVNLRGEWRVKQSSGTLSIGDPGSMFETTKVF